MTNEKWKMPQQVCTNFPFAIFLICHRTRVLDPEVTSVMAFSLSEEKVD
jgi:hypothetical protein